MSFSYAKYTYPLPIPTSLWIGVHSLGTSILPWGLPWLEAIELKRHTQHTNVKRGQNDQNRFSHSKYHVEDNSCCENLCQFQGAKDPIIARESHWEDVVLSLKLDLTLECLFCPACPRQELFQGYSLKSIRCWDHLDSLGDWAPLSLLYKLLTFWRADEIWDLLILSCRNKPPV